MTVAQALLQAAAAADRWGFDVRFEVDHDYRIAKVEVYYANLRQMSFLSSLNHHSIRVIYHDGSRQEYVTRDLDDLKRAIVMLDERVHAARTREETSPVEEPSAEPTQRRYQVWGMANDYYATNRRLLLETNDEAFAQEKARECTDETYTARVVENPRWRP